MYTIPIEKRKDENQMADIISINEKNEKRYKEVQGRIAELEAVLGYQRDEEGNSLSKRARREGGMTETFYRRLQKRHPAEYEELVHLEAERMQLEKELGIEEELEKFLAEMED